MESLFVTRGQARCDMNKVLKLGCGCLGIFFLMFLLFASWLIVDTYKSYNHDPDIASRKEAIDTSVKVEKLTGFKLPEYDVVKYKSSGYTFFGDFADTIVVRFRSATIDDVHHLLEESAVFHITSDSTGYDHINNERDFAIKITLDHKSKTGQIMLFNGLVPAS